MLKLSIRRSPVADGSVFEAPRERTVLPFTPQVAEATEDLWRKLRGHVTPLAAD